MPRIVYKLADGSRCPGTTTITGVMDKPALGRWHNQMGLKGVDTKTYVDALADAGTLAHNMVEDHLLKRETDFSEFDATAKDLAENAMLKFYDWEKENEIEVIDIELSLVSETHAYGGTIDIYGMLHGKKTLIDIKTSKGVYADQHTQVTAYEHLLVENGREVEDVRILRIGRDEGEGFDDIVVPKRDLHWSRFLACRELYEINKAIKRKGK